MSGTEWSVSEMDDVEAFKRKRNEVLARQRNAILQAHDRSAREENYSSDPSGFKLGLL